MLTKVDCTLCENVFGRYCVPRSSQHRPAAQAVLNGGVWELETVNFMREHVRDRDIIHAGMYFGDFLPGLASAMASGRTIYGFEPNPENFNCAQWTAVLNTLTNVRLHNAALGAEQRQAYLKITGKDGKAFGGLSHIVDDWSASRRNNDGVTPISLVTIDEALPATADVGIIQLDVEGYEASALIGGLKTIRRCRPIIIVETVPDAFVQQYLAPLGYSQTETVRRNSVFTARR